MSQAVTKVLAHVDATLDESLARLAKDGQIAREVALAHADDGKWMRRELGDAASTSASVVLFGSVL